MRFTAKYALTDVRESPEINVELARLSGSRGKSEMIVVSGGIWGSGDVVVASPRFSKSRVEIVDFDHSAYPALAEACEVRCPSLDD